MALTKWWRRRPLPIEHVELSNFVEPGYLPAYPAPRYEINYRCVGCGLITYNYVVTGYDTKSLRWACDLHWQDALNHYIPWRDAELAQISAEVRADVLRVMAQR